MAISPTGRQWTLTSGDAEAVVVEVGGGLRSLRVGGLDLVAGYREEQMPRAGRGQLLIPWPNRIRDGRYSFAGQEHELPITERATGTASHGLTRWSPFVPTEQEEEAITLRHTLHPRPGYPFALDVAVTWTLEASGLRCATALTNVGAGPAPVGYGAHPYLALGGTKGEDVRVQVPAEEVVLVDEQTKTPTSTVGVAGTPFDLRSGPALAGRSIDHAYTGLARGEDGCWTITVTTPDRQVAVWGDAAMGWAQVFTGQVDAAEQPGVAVEPLSCPADAFRSGDGLVVLEPGQSWRGQWGIDLTR